LIKPSTARNHRLRKNLVIGTILLTLSSCLSLPDGPGDPSRHYGLLPAQSSCRTPVPQTMKLAITQVAAGLEGDRMIQLSSESGELVYLSDMRWASDTQILLEQRLAQDLETAGFTIITSHHKLASTSELNCELRALNLRGDSTNSANKETEETAVRRAEFALSCALYDPVARNNRIISASGSSTFEQLRADEIAKALSESYHQGFVDLCKGLIKLGG